MCLALERRIPKKAAIRITPICSKVHREGSIDGIYYRKKDHTVSALEGTEDTVQQTTPCDDSSIMPPMRDHFKKPLSQDDRYDLRGKSVACRIKALANRQRLIVEKRINDILFEAEMGMLNTPTVFNNFDYGSSSSTSNRSPSANATLCRYWLLTCGRSDLLGENLSSSMTNI
nr:unnamed protein product [Callosobruchus analis]